MDRADVLRSEKVASDGRMEEMVEASAGLLKDERFVDVASNLLAIQDTLLMMKILIDSKVTDEGFRQYLMRNIAKASAACVGVAVACGDISGGRGEQWAKSIESILIERTRNTITAFEKVGR